MVKHNLSQFNGLEMWGGFAFDFGGPRPNSPCPMCPLRSLARTKGGVTNDHGVNHVVQQ